MRIVLTLVVRDEVDIIEDNLRYHLDRVADAVVVTDNGSIDGTREVLADFARTGRVHVIDEPVDDFQQWRWVTRMARLASVEYGADWVLHCDADEFWWPDEGDLRDAFAALPPQAGIVPVRRHNFVPTAAEDGPYRDRMVLRDLYARNGAGRPILGKQCHRGHPEVLVAQGNHDIKADGLARFPAGVPVTILHYPLRTYAQFERKVVLGGRAYARNTELTPDIGAGWRALYRLYLDGGLRAYYDEQVPDSTGLLHGVMSGRYVVDCRMQAYFGEPAAPPAPPPAVTVGPRREPPAAEPPVTVEVVTTSLEERLAGFIDGARDSLVCALYDLRATAVLAALRDAARRGVDVCLRHDPADSRPAGVGPDPKPPGTAAALHEWTGSACPTPEGLYRQDNDCVILHGAAVAQRYLDGRSDAGPRPAGLRPAGRDAQVCALFGGAARDAVVDLLAGAQRVRLAAYQISDPVILTALRRRRDAGADVAGVYNPHGMAAVLGDARRDRRQFWFLADRRFVAGPSMNSKLLVVDDAVAVTGSYNFASPVHADSVTVIRSPSAVADLVAYWQARSEAARR